MQTMDILRTAPEGALVSPAAERNAESIRLILAAHLPAKGQVLEIASGSGQHAIAFASALPDLDWQPSDPSAEARNSIDAWARTTGLSNLRPALNVDMMDSATWPSDSFDALACINMVHISPWKATEGLMKLAGHALPIGGLLYLYGPYREGDQPLAASNATFDESLKSRNPAWGLREVSDVAAEARKHGLRLTARHAMPANNLSLLFRRC